MASRRCRFPPWNSAFDAIFPPGTSGTGRRVGAGDLRQSDEHQFAFVEKLPTWKSLMHMFPIDGVPADVGGDETAWAYRNAVSAQVIAGVDGDPANTEKFRVLAISYRRSSPHDARNRLRQLQRARDRRPCSRHVRLEYPRLAKIKRQYEPDNIFGVNQDIHLHTRQQQRLSITLRVPDLDKRVVGMT